MSQTKRTCPVKPRTAVATPTDRKSTVISGASRAQRPLVAKVLSQSGSLWLEPTQDETAEPTWLAQKFIAAPKLPVQFYMDAGVFEVDVSGRGSGILVPNRHLRDVLRAKGYAVSCREFPAGHDYANWRGTLADGLITLFGQKQ
ncbi:MAG: hypothetical protein HYX27_18350 [Acidobacteria bacterium]|nr:hypothetical protein [Acidobacteriota bacterium]